MKSARDTWLPGVHAVLLLLFFAVLAYAAWREAQPVAVLEHPYVCVGEHCWVQDTWVLQ